MCDKSDLHAVFNNGKEAVVTTTYHPNENVDFSMTNKFDLTELSAHGFELSQIRPAFSVNIHD